MNIDFKILFSNEPFNRKQVDSAFLEEFQMSQISGIKSYFFDHEELVDNDKFVTDIDPNDKCTLIYRGWMLKPEQYAKLYHKILERTNGYVTLINSPAQYENLHCFPMIYKDIKEYTPKIVLLNKFTFLDIQLVKQQLDFDFFIKDHVKSIKTDKGIERISENILPLHLYNKVEEFIEERGNLFTKGIVFKEFVDLKKTDGCTHECRAFFLYGQLIDLSFNSTTELPISKRFLPPTEFVKHIGDILSKKGNFFTVDFGLLEKNRWMVLETGDGGVSGLSPTCSAVGFYSNIILNMCGL